MFFKTRGSLAALMICVFASTSLAAWPPRQVRLPPSPQVQRSQLQLVPPGHAAVKVATSPIPAPVKVATSPIPEAPPNILVRHFFATWCEPCKAAAPAVAKLEGQGFPMIHFDVDSEDGKRQCRTWNVRVVPTFIMGVDGKDSRTNDVEELGRWLRAVPKSTGSAEHTGPIVALPPGEKPTVKVEESKKDVETMPAFPSTTKPAGSLPPGGSR